MDPAAIPAEAKPVQQMEMMTSGDKAGSCYWDGGAGLIPSAGARASGEWREDGADAIRCDFALEWKERSKGRTFDWSLKSNVAVSASRQTPMVIFHGPSPAEATWTVTLSASRRLIDGALWDEARLLEDHGKARAVVPGYDGTLARPVKKITSQDVTYFVGDFDRFSDLVTFLSPVGNEPVDPFVASATVQGTPSISEYRAVVAPPALQTSPDSIFLDVKELLNQSGAGLGEGDFAGYDPFTRLLRVATTNAERLEVLDLVLNSGCVLSPASVMMTLSIDTEDLQAPGKRVMLATHSGMETSLICKEARRREVMHWTIGPTVGESGEILELRNDWRLPASVAGTAVADKGSIKVSDGAKTPVSSHGVGAGKTSLSVQAQIRPATRSADKP